MTSKIESFLGLLSKQLDEMNDIEQIGLLMDESKKIARKRIAEIQERQNEILNKI